jgi:hypothetical protein
MTNFVYMYLYSLGCWVQCTMCIRLSTNPPYCTNCICFKRIQIYRYLSVTISVYIYISEPVDIYSDHFHLNTKHPRFPFLCLFYYVSGHWKDYVRCGTTKHWFGHLLFFRLPSPLALYNLNMQRITTVKYVLTYDAWKIVYGTNRPL